LLLKEQGTVGALAIIRRHAICQESAMLQLVKPDCTDIRSYE